MNPFDDDVPDADLDQQRHDAHARAYLARTTSVPDRRNPLVGYEVANILGGWNQDVDAIRALLTQHWNHGIYSDEEIEDFAELAGEADIDDMQQLRADILAKQSPDTLTFLQTKWNGPPPPTATSIPGLYDFALDKGRLKSRFTTQPAPRDFVIPKLLIAGQTAVGAGFGGARKTLFLLHTGVSICLGRPLFDLGGPNRPCKVGSVILVLGEDDQDEIDRRLGAIKDALALTPNEIQHLNERLLVFPTAGEDIRLTSHHDRTIATTGLADRIIARCREHAAACGLPVRLVGLDHYLLISGGELNSNEDAALLNQQTARIATQTGAAVITLAHLNKGSAAKGREKDQHAVLGAGAVVNSARLTLILDSMSAKEASKFGIADTERRSYVQLKSEKGNAIALGHLCWLRNRVHQEYESISLERVNLTAHTPATDAREQHLRPKVWALITKHPGKYSMKSFTTEYAEHFACRVQVVKDVVLDLMKDGHLIQRDPTLEERRVYDLTGQVKQVLDIGPTPLAVEHPYVSPK